ncbi:MULTISPECIES: DUF159 family protein [unclassified Sphingomonas]|uniref:DUF159 family protein n=1 Tax=Novosphingobium rhizosphaerae TaxID=1551649 RepID=UPI0015CDB1DF
MTLAYTLDATADAVAQALGADRNGDVWAGGAVRAGGYAPVVVRGRDGRRRIVPRQWGVPPPPRGQHIVTTVRNVESPFWIGTLRHPEMRCVVPATHFRAGGPRRWWRSPDAPIMGFAGIWRDSEVPSFAVLTVAVDTLSGPAGMPTSVPLLLNAAEQMQWLAQGWKDVESLVRPVHPDRIAELGA